MLRHRPGMFRKGNDRRWVDSASVQFLPEFFRRQIVGAGQLGIFKSESFHFAESAGNVFLELLAQAIELQSNRPLKLAPVPTDAAAAIETTDSMETKEPTDTRTDRKFSFMNIS